MDREELTVPGMTGVDLSLEIAGPGSRAYAFVIDWHIRLLIAIAWMVVGMLVVNGGLRLNPQAGRWGVLLTMLPPALIYFFYHPVVELLMRGQTPGKRMAGVRIVNREGGPPGVGAILIRNAFRLLDSLPVLYVIGLVCTFVTAQRIRIGDMAAGTLLVVNATEPARSFDRLVAQGRDSRLSSAALDLLDQLLERWKEMDPPRRQQIARALLARIDADGSPPEQMTEAQLHARLAALAGAAQGA